ncbi:MAG: InlB B-repeat-containing protein [Ruminococcus sp.]
MTYNQNYDGAPEAEVAEVVKGQNAEEQTPVRDGYEFVGWYIDPDYTEAYDFSNPITDNVELYGLWKKMGQTMWMSPLIMTIMELKRVSIHIR